MEDCYQISYVSGIELLPGTNHNGSGLHCFPHWIVSFLRAGALCSICVMWTHPNSGRKLKQAPVLKFTCLTYLSILPCYPLALLLDSVPGGPILFFFKKIIYF